MRPHIYTADAYYGGEKRHRIVLPRLQVTYTWMPPFEGASCRHPNRLEVVFSGHGWVALGQAGRTYDVAVEAGGFYVIGEEPTTLLNVSEHSDTLEMYPDMAFLGTILGGTFSLDPTLGRQSGAQRFTINARMLGLAHVLRQACLGLRSLSPIEASSLEHLLASHLLGDMDGRRRRGQLSSSALRRVISRIEDALDQPLTLDDLAAEAHLSAFHFARSFQRSTGLAPHRYVIARKLERAKNQLLTTSRPVAEIAYGLGFENLHHFRRQFRSHFGVQPAELRSATK